MGRRGGEGAPDRALQENQEPLVLRRSILADHILVECLRRSAVNVELSARNGPCRADDILKLLPGPHRTALSFLLPASRPAVLRRRLEGKQFALDDLGISHELSQDGSKVRLGELTDPYKLTQC
jgi:hypothetical protein